MTRKATKKSKVKRKHTRVGNPNWQPGVSGNPSSQWTPTHQPPPTMTGSLRKYVREHTGNGQEVANFMLAVMRADLGALIPMQYQRSDAMKFLRVRLEDRMRAAEWLANRGNGTVVQTSEHKDLPSGGTTNTTTINFNLLSLDDRRQYLDLLRKAKDAAALLPAPTVIDPREVEADRRQAV